MVFYFFVSVIFEVITLGYFDIFVRLCRATLIEVMESKRPLTRDVLEARIAKLQQEIDSLLQQKAYAECDELQLQLDNLLAKRVELPTLEEMKEAVQRAEQDIAIAAEKRDFKGAAEAQKAFDAAKSRLEEYLDLHKEENAESEENDMQIPNEKNQANKGIQSRVQLELELKNLSTEVNVSLAEKNYFRASEIQPRIDELEKMRSLFPLRANMEKKVGELRILMDKAIKVRNFTEAGKIDQEISELEKKIEEEKKHEREVGKENQNFENSEDNDKTKAITILLNNETRIINSRIELETEIKSINAKIDEAAKTKQFKKAKSLQEDIDKLIAIRIKFPSLNEIMQNITKKKDEMNAVIKNKDFTTAELLNDQIEKLQNQYNAEQEKQEESQKKIKTEIQAKFTTPISTKTSSLTIRQTPNIISPKAAKKINVKVKSYVTTTTNNNNKNDNTKINTANKRSHMTSKQVSRLRPSKPHTSLISDNVLSVCQMLASKRGDASIVTGGNGGLAGIITDTDITRRVVAKYLDPSSTNISKVMTANPTCVLKSDSAMDAMSTMVENHFRHLPVVDDNGAIVGVLGMLKKMIYLFSKMI